MNRNLGLMICALVCATTAVACRDEVSMPVIEANIITRRSAVRGVFLDSARQPLDSFRVYVVGGGTGRYSSEGAPLTDAEGRFDLIVNEVDGIIVTDSVEVLVVVEPVRLRDKQPAGPHRTIALPRWLRFTPSTLTPRYHDMTIVSPAPK